MKRVYRPFVLTNDGTPVETFVIQRYRMTLELSNGIIKTKLIKQFAQNVTTRIQ